jgi:O-acetylhomoserine (thiol)-lyase
MPVYHTAAFEFKTAEEMADAFLGNSPDHTYSRITNPTVQYFERRVQSMTGALGVTALNSGMAAITNTIIALAKSGSNIVTSPHLFGNTYSFFATTIAEFGVEARFCDLTDLQQVEANVDENTCCVFLEIITNPQMEVADLKALAEIAHRKNAPLVADTTVIPFHAFKAADFGVDIETLSSTKYISGGATSLGGLIIDYGKFDWKKSKKLAGFAAQFGYFSFTAKMRKEIHRNMGAYMTPHTAYMQTLGLETLALRYDKSSENSQKLAEALCRLPQVESVNYPGLASSPYHEIAARQFGKQSGAMLTFDLKSREACFKFINNLKLIKRATNLFDNKTLAIHPASTIFGTFTAEIRQKMNVSEKTIRLSVGLETVDDLLDDIKQALEN